MMQEDWVVCGGGGVLCEGSYPKVLEGAVIFATFDL